MWKKYMRTMQSLTYRKKYKCPKCSNYCLHIIHDCVCECEDDCDLEEYDNEEIEIITALNDFRGYYTAQEIKDNFWEIDDDKINNCFVKITDDILLERMSSKQKEKIEHLYHETVQIDERLDDIVVKHLTQYEIAEHSELTSFSYVINLVEDIHHFLNITCNDLILFYYGVELAKEHFYSGRFFFNNCIDHISSADERIYVFLGIYYGYNFSENLDQNRASSIKNYLKKNADYKSSHIKVKFDEIHGLSNIRAMRDNNTHDINYVNRQIINDVKKNIQNSYKYDKDGDEFDLEFFKPKIPDIISEIERYYDLLSCIISIIEGESFQGEKVPMLKLFSEERPPKILCKSE